MPGHSAVQVLVDPGGHVTAGTVHLACAALNVVGKAKSVCPACVDSDSVPTGSSAALVVA